MHVEANGMCFVYLHEELHLHLCADITVLMLSASLNGTSHAEMARSFSLPALHKKIVRLLECNFCDTQFPCDSFYDSYFMKYSFNF